LRRNVAEEDLAYMEAEFRRGSDDESGEESEELDEGDPFVPRNIRQVRKEAVLASSTAEPGRSNEQGPVGSEEAHTALDSGSEAQGRF
jgi:hypothetical protein